MDSRRLIFDSSSSSSSSSSHGRLILLGSAKSVSGSRGGRSTVVGVAEEARGSKLRPFFTSPDEIYEEYYEVLPLEKKRRLTSEQIQMLERSFDEENKLEPERKSELAKKLGLPPRQVAVWFQNRRARWKNQQAERDFDRLKASYDALLLDHDVLAKDNDRLRSQLHLADDQAASSGNVMDLNSNIQQKVDDLLSTGSGGNAAAKVDAHHLLVDSREPIILPESYRVPNNGILSDQDDMSDEGCNYYSSSVFSGYQKQQEEAHLKQWLDCVESILLP